MIVTVFLVFRLVSIPWLLITTGNKNWGLCLTIAVVDNFMKEEKQKCSCCPVCSPCLHACQFQPVYQDLTFVIYLAKTEQSFWKQNSVNMFVFISFCV